MTITSSGNFVPLPVYEEETGGNNYPRPFANEMLNSRTPVKVSGRLLEIRWKVPLDPFFPANFILTANDNYIAFGSGRWQLLDAGGKSEAADFLGNSDIIFDAVHGLFYYADRFGQIAAVGLSSREKLFTMQVNGLEDVERKFIYRNNGSFLIADKIVNKNPHNPSPNRFVLLESYAMDDPPLVENGNLTSYKELNQTYFSAENSAAAANKDTFVCAINNKIIISGTDLKLKSELDGEFTPITLSLDESGRIYMTIINSEHKLALWVVSSEGELLVDTQIPVENQLNSIPPIVAYNHSIFLVFSDRVFSYSEDGNLRWQSFTGGETGGAVVTSDNKLLLSEGEYIMQFNESGEREFIFQFPGERLTTPPVVNTNNEIIAATEGSIYLLSPQK